jgi:hypothetical protein
VVEKESVNKQAALAARPPALNQGKVVRAKGGKQKKAAVESADGRVSGEMLGIGTIETSANIIKRGPGRPQKNVAGMTPTMNPQQLKDIVGIEPKAIGEQQKTVRRSARTNGPNSVNTNAADVTDHIPLVIKVPAMSKPKAQDVAQDGFQDHLVDDDGEPDIEGLNDKEEPEIEKVDSKGTPEIEMIDEERETELAREHDGSMKMNIDLEINFTSGPYSELALDFEAKEHLLKARMLELEAALAAAKAEA